MIYGNYKTARNASWKVLIDFKVKRLPVNVLDIAVSSGIKVIQNCDVNILKADESGVSITDGDKWYIVYDNSNSRQRIRFTIAHELGHVFLGHSLINGYNARTIDKRKPEVESQADIFASRLLAPACVLWGLGLRSAVDISKTCDISLEAAKIRAERMDMLYARNKFLTSPLERLLYEQFEDYVKESK